MRLVDPRIIILLQEISSSLCKLSQVGEEEKEVSGIKNKKGGIRRTKRGGKIGKGNENKKGIHYKRRGT